MTRATVVSVYVHAVRASRVILNYTNSTKKSSTTLNKIRTPARITNVDNNVTMINGVGGTYPLITPRSAIPNGIANTQPLATLDAVDIITFVSLSSGEYTPVSGEVTIHAVMNGNAVIVLPINQMR